MLPNWVDSILDFNVDQREIQRPGKKPYYANSHTMIGVLHTTEGDTLSGAWTTLSQNHDAPHFIVGEGQIIQTRPLTAQAAALHGNGPFFANANATLQIEIVGRSQQTPWLPADQDTLDALCAIVQWASSNGLDIPLQVPSPDWKDDCSDCALPWAANNSRRKRAAAGLWPAAKGWWMHMEVPGQAPTWHWDCGAIQRSKLLDLSLNYKPQSSNGNS